MASYPDPLFPVLEKLRRPLTLTWAGMIAERLTHAFWPLWTLLAACAAALMLGLHEFLPVEVVWGALMLSGLGLLVFAVQGAMRFRWPQRREALDRVDQTLAGHPLAALADRQAIGRGDTASETLWRMHLQRMTERASTAKAVEPDLKLSRRDPFGLRYIALLGLVMALLFGSVWRAGTVANIAPGQAAPQLATGPAWEGWIEPPGYTGLPTLYLNDQTGVIKIPEGSRVVVRLYGEAGVLGVTETVSGRAKTDGEVDPATRFDQSFDVVSDGTLTIEGPGGQSWNVVTIPDLPPTVVLADEGARTTFDGQMSQPFRVTDDYGVVGGTATFTLDLPRVDRAHGLVVDPEPRDPIVLDLPMPITGNRNDFTENLIENLSEHPWAHLPVKLELTALDARDQAGTSAPMYLKLPARRFFDPLAASMVEQRRDLLWSLENSKRVSQVLRAVSYKPEPNLFRSEAAYLRLRVIIRQLEAGIEQAALTDETRDEIAQALWDLAILLEDGDIGDALERMREAQERLSEAMRNGASEEEIARLMQELRDATQDYLRQKSQQAQREGEQNGQQQSGEMMSLNQQDLQDMMDRIQDLMEQGRFAEAQQALEEFQELMENLRVTEGQGQDGQSPGEQAMEGLADTLREQQGLSDQAFRDLQEQFNPNSQAGQSQGNEGQSGGEGRGQSHDGQGSGRGDQSGSGQDGSTGQDGERSLAQRQEALRQELERQRNGLPGAGSEAGDAAREALDRAEGAMRGAEDALRDGDLAEAIDRQSEAMEALRDGMRNLGEALAENQTPGGQGQALGQFGEQQSDPLGRAPGSSNGGVGDQNEFARGEDVYRRARDLLDEIRRRSGESNRPDIERDYLERLLDRF